MSGLFRFIQAGALLACLVISGCGGEPFTYAPDHELKPGPGLLSGDDGEFNIVGKPEEPKEAESEQTVEDHGGD